jgi:hypothetical protein
MSKAFNSISIEIFLIFISIISGIIIYITLYGFLQDTQLILFSILISLYLICFPNFVKSNSKFLQANKWYSSLSFFHWVGLFTIFLGGMINERLEINLHYLFSILGIIFFIYILISSKKSKHSDSRGFLFYSSVLLIFILFSIFITTAYYGNNYTNPLMYEKIINGSWAHRDTIFNSALSGMIKTHGVSSIGLEGVSIPHYYHTFSHRLYAAFSSILNTNSLNFYSLVYPIIFIPFFFQTFIYCSVSINKFFINKNIKSKNIYNNLNYWILFFILFGIPVPVYWAPEQYNFIRSQSYLLSFALSFSFISTLATNNSFLIRKKFPSFNLEDFSLLLFCLVNFYCISLSKLSFLYFLLIVFLYFYLRKKLFLNLFHNLLLLCLAIISLLIYLKIVAPITSLWDAHEGSYFSQLYDTSENFYFYFYFSAFYILLRFYNLKIYSFKKLYVNLLKSKIIDIELLIVVAIGLFLFPYIYSNGIQIFVAYVLIISNINIIPVLRYKYDN